MSIPNDIPPQSLTLKTRDGTLHTVAAIWSKDHGDRRGGHVSIYSDLLEEFSRRTGVRFPSQVAGADTLKTSDDISSVRRRGPTVADRCVLNDVFQDFVLSFQALSVPDEGLQSWSFHSDNDLQAWLDRALEDRALLNASFTHSAKGHNFIVRWTGSCGEPTDPSDKDSAVDLTGDVTESADRGNIIPLTIYADDKAASALGNEVGVAHTQDVIDAVRSLKTYICKRLKEDALGIDKYFTAEQLAKVRQIEIETRYHSDLPDALQPLLHDL